MNNCQYWMFACAMQLLSLVVFSDITHAQIFKCENEQGQTSYTEEPCEEGAKDLSQIIQRKVGAAQPKPNSSVNTSSESNTQKHSLPHTHSKPQQ